MDFDIKETGSKYFLYVKIGKNRFYRSNRPLLVLTYRNFKRIDLNHLRDVDLSISIKEGDPIEYGVIKVEEGHLKKYAKIMEKSDIEKIGGMEIIFEDYGNVHMVNERVGFQGRTRAEIHFKGDGYKIRWSVWKMDRDYVMSNPSIELTKMEYIDQIK